MDSIDFELTECDEAGNTVASYVQTSDLKRSNRARVDIILPKDSKSKWQKVLDVFLPAGYPHSVTEDYLEYQIYDSLQAFSSSIAGLLSSRAVLEGVGVGDATATPTAALVLSIFQESIGRIATILFAWRLGTSFEPECKMYRLLADIFNDLAMILDCLSPVFPKTLRVFILSFASALRALCGVAAGSSKASLSAHFARWGNLAELNAKDSSQETVISLLGMLAGSFLVSRITSTTSTWIALISLLIVHLATNYLAVRAVTMRSLNRQRASILFSNIIEQNIVLSPEEVSRKEYIFHTGKTLKSAANQRLGSCRIGVSFRYLIRTLSSAEARKTGSFQLDDRSDVQQLLSIFEKENYILWFDERTCTASIVLKRGASSPDQLKSWVHGLLTAKHRASLRDQGSDALPGESVHSQLKTTLKESEGLLARYEKAIKDAGWDLTMAGLETQPGTRVSGVQR